MKKLTIALAISSLISAHLQAEDNLETITVTASRGAQLATPTLANNIVIERAQIELAQVESVPELLSRYAGIDVAQSGGRGQVASVFLRGASSDHTLVLIDGLRVNTATTGGVTWSTLSPSMIERIEIVKGPRTAVWGSDAIGGVINIITRKHADNSGVLTAKYGKHNNQSYYLGGNFSHGNGSTTLAVNKESSDGFDVLKSAEPDQDGYDNLSVAINGNQHINDRFRLNWLLKASKQDTDFDSTYLNESENKNREWQLAADYDWPVSDTTNTTSVSLGAIRDQNLSFGNGRSEKKGDLFETRRQQVSLVNTTKFNPTFTLVVGSDQYNEKVVSSTEYARSKRRGAGYFAHALFAEDKVSAEFAVRYDDVENIDGETTYNASVAYNLIESVQIGYSKGSGFKAPTFNDLYFPFGGNPDLLSETSHSDEVNISYSKDDTTVSMSWYSTDIENLIEWAPNAANVWQPRNIANADITGVDVTVNYQGLGGQHTFNYGYLNAKDVATDKQLARRAKNQFSYQFMARFDRLDLLLNYEYKGKRTDRNNQLRRYQRVDLSLNYHFNDAFSGQLKLHNLFDEEYETVFGYNTLGRAVYIGGSYQL